MTPSNLTAIDFLAWRKRMKWTRRFAAKKLGCSYASVQNFESGRRNDGKGCKIGVLVALAMAAVENRIPPLGGYPQGK
jgi:transcriptional regulator with XRE-family HTH domain